MAPRRTKYPFPALMSALVAGLGQVTKGDARKGLKMMIWFYLGFPIIIYAALLFNAYLFLLVFAAFVVIYPVFWVTNIMDAYSTQVRRRA
jgi:hypothetical protein